MSKYTCSNYYKYIVLVRDREKDMTKSKENSNEENLSFTIKNAKLQKISDGSYQLNLTITHKMSTNVIKNNTNRNLTKRELEVLEELYKGKTNLQIAKELNISFYTAKAHVSNILQKLSVDNRQKATVLAVNEKIIDL